MNDLRCLRAIERRDINLIKKLISRGQEFNEGVGQPRMCPKLIHYAVHNNFTEAVQLLVNYGCNVNVKYTPDMRTPLYMSALIGNNTIASILCENGANVNEVTAKGETPLFAAIESMATTNDETIVQTLLSFGAEVNIRAINGSTPLTKAIELNCLAVIKIVVEKGAKLDSLDYRELKCALKQNKNPIIEYLLENYCKQSCGQMNNSSESPVDLCLQYFNLKAMKLSIELGFKATDKLFADSLVVLKTILPNSHQSIEDAIYCFDYLLTFRHLIDFNQTFVFKYELPANLQIITGNFLTYALLFNCSDVSKKLIQIGVHIESSFLNFYRFSYSDLDSLKLLYFCGLQFPKNFCTKCYPNTSNSEDKALNKSQFKEFYIWIKTQSLKPFRLTELTRISLRKALGIRLLGYMSSLDIPTPIIRFLSFE